MPSLPQQYTTDVTDDVDGSNTTLIQYWGPSLLDPSPARAVAVNSD